MARDWRLYAQDIAEYCDKLSGIRAQLESPETLRNSPLHFLAAERCLEVIGEAAKNLPLAEREKHSAVPWKNIIGMRDIIAHGYFSVSPAVIWDTMKNDLDILKSAVEIMLASSGEKDS